MTPERYQRLGQLYHAALEVEPESRAIFLDGACGSDEELRREVESLLAAHNQVGNYFAAPALEVAAGLVAGRPNLSLAGKSFSYYRVLSLIGVGGMGEVYLAEDTRLGRKVALKMLPKAFTQDEERVRRFEQEARAASALNHPNIVTIYEVGQVDGRHFIATEYIEGQTLRGRLSGGQIELREALEIGAQMASALEAAHEAGIVHRDIKPENVMVRRDGLVKVLDFGLAKLAERRSQSGRSEATSEVNVKSTPGLVMGTLSYMSPEQVRGEKLDERTDLFSLGIVVYEMIAGESPFAAVSSAETLAAILDREPKSLAKYMQDVPGEMERIIEKALRKNREERYQMASDLVIDLKSLKEELGIEARLKRSLQPDTDNRGTTTQSGSQATVATLENLAVRTDDVVAARTMLSAGYLIGEIKGRKLWVAIAATAVVVAVLAYNFYPGSTGEINNPGKDHDKSTLPALRLEKLTDTGQSKIVAISPDGKYVAYTRQTDNKMSIWLRQLATNTNLEIVPATGFIFGMAFANSGESLYFVKGVPTALYRVSMLGGVPTKIVDTPQGNFSISPDDSQIAFIREVINRDGLREHSLVIARSDGGDERRLLVGTYPYSLDVPVWSPDGQAVICSYGNSYGGGQDVGLIEVKVDGGAKKELSAERFFNISNMDWLPDKTGIVMSAKKRHEDINQLWRLSYPGMEVRPLTDGLIDYLDLSFAVSADKAVASQLNLVSDVWVSPDHDPQNLRKLTPATNAICWTPDGQLIYSSKASNNLDLWEMGPDGAGARQLTTEAPLDYLPAVAPDNRYVVFVSNRSGAFQIWRMNRDGSNQIQLTDGASHSNPAVSPDGKWVIYNSTADWQLWKVPIDGGNPVRLTDYLAINPAISPDGRLVACVGRSGSSRELFILSSDGGPPLKRFEFGEWGPRLQWTADGKAVIYSARRAARMVLIKQPLDGQPPSEVGGFEQFEHHELFDFSYSFDHRSLAVTRGAWQHDVVLISGFARP